jgi:hypothetical protein
MEDLAQEALLKFYKNLAIRVERDPKLLRICQEEMANSLLDFPLSIVEYLQDVGGVDKIYFELLGGSYSLSNNLKKNR